jgi:hypothetical protein
MPETTEQYKYLATVFAQNQVRLSLVLGSLTCLYKSLLVMDQLTSSTLNLGAIIQDILFKTRDEVKMFCSYT